MRWLRVQIPLAPPLERNKMNIESGFLRLDEIDDLCQSALMASKLASPKLSGYHVGAAILDSEDNVSIGFNTEFDIHSCTIHAEQMALVEFLKDSKGLKARAIAVYTKSDPAYFPCGLCRQCLFEYFGKDLIVIAFNGMLDNTNNFIIRYKYLSELLPEGFRKNESVV